MLLSSLNAMADPASRALGAAGISSTADVLAYLTLPISFAIYLLLVWDRNTQAASKGDNQLGVKTTMATLTLISVALLAEGAHRLLSPIITFQFDGYVDTLKASIPDTAVGAIVLIFVWKVFVPRTNHEQYPKAMRLTAGACAVIAGVFAVKALDHGLTGILHGEFRVFMSSLLALIISGGIAFVGLMMLSKLSGVETQDITDGVARAAHGVAERTKAAVDAARRDPMEEAAAAAAPAQPGYAAPAAPAAQPGYAPQAPAAPVAQPGYAPQAPASAPPAQPGYTPPAAPQAPAAPQPNVPPRPGYPPPPGGGGGWKPGGQ